MIRWVLAVIIICLPLKAFAVIPEERIVNGLIYVRIINDQPFAINCLIQDSAGGYYPFWLYPRSVGRWYLVHGMYRWDCMR